MRKQSTLILALFVLASVAAMAQGRRISTFPYSQPFNFVTTTTTAFPTTNVDGGEFTLDDSTLFVASTNILSAGISPQSGALRLQTTNAKTRQGFVWYGDFTSRTAGTLSIDWSKVFNTTAGTRINQLRVATNNGSGTTFTDIPGAVFPQDTNTTNARSGTFTVQLPATLDNKSDVRIWIYEYHTGTGGGNHPRHTVDNLTISAPACDVPGTPAINSLTATNLNRAEMMLTQGANTDSIIIIRRTGLAPTAAPATGVRYVVGQGLNFTDTVVYSGVAPASSFVDENLQANTQYYYAVYGFATCGNSGYYSNPATSNVTTLSCAGSPGAITGVMDVARTQTSVTLDYVRSLRTDSVLVIRRRNAAPSATPSTGVAYTTGQALNVFDTVAYFGPASDVITANNLQADSLYYFAVYGYQSCNMTYSSPAGVDSARTYCTRTISNVTDLQVLYTTATTAGLLVSGASDVQNVIIFSRGPDTNRAVPTAGRLYNIGDVVGDDTVRYVGPVRRPIVTGLAPNTPYEFFALALQPCNYSYSAAGDTVLTRTLGACVPTIPLPVDSAFVTRNVADTLRLNWRRALGADRYLVVARIDSTPTGAPVNGTWYLRGDSLGNRTVVYGNTSDSTITITGIPRNTALFIRVYSFTNCQLTYGPSSSVLATATLGTDSSQRFAMKANVLDTIEFGGARIEFAEAPSTDGSILITRRSGHPGTLGIPMQRNNEPLINAVSADRWWQLTRNGLGEFDVRLRFDVTGLPGMQDISDLEIIYRPTTSSSWTDIRTAFYDTTNTGGRAYLYSNVQPFVGEYAIGANSNRNILPVKLTSFEGYSRGRANVLRWATASEENNAGFRLSRSVAGDDAFVTVADYTTDASLVGAGTSTQEHRYGVVDADASLTAGRRYIYRLEEISLDGQVSEIGRVALETRVVTGASVASISPNPTTTDVMTTLRFTVAEQGPLAVTLVDVTGTTLRTLLEESATDSGERALAFSTADLAAGTYFCQITTTNGRTVVPVVITR